jgi:hypothetical protein
MNHLSVGVYNNNTHVINIVKDVHLQSHIEYNKTFRPGRLLFIDGKYNSGGMVDDATLKNLISEWEKKIASFKIDLSKSSEKYI